LTDVSEVLTASIITVKIIALMMLAVSTSEMSVSFYQTAWCNFLEDSHLLSCHCENLKSHVVKSVPLLISDQKMKIDFVAQLS
jgi:hypothetical protein